MYTRISIHAPTRGATSPGEDSPLLNTISIHAPTRGATSFRALQTFANGFQSTLPRGERLYVWVAGCTITYFNPRSHEGSDGYSPARLQKIPISIHAPTRGATGMSTNISHFIGNFNPRSHEGSDQYLERVRSIDSEISIHAPTRGATTTSMGSNYLLNI